MPFKTFTKSEYPRRQWLVEGEPDTGKSTFAAQMKSPILPIDADHRFEEVVDLAGGPVFQLSDDPLDHVAADRIAALVSEGIRGSGTKTIVVDSLTAIIAPLVTKAFRGNANGSNRNKVAAYAEKATAMRLLQDTLTGTGCDILWIYHVYQGRDNSAKEVEKTSITELELSRVLRSCNMHIRLARKGGVYTATVVWARRGRFVYAHKPKKLVDEYFLTGNVVRRILNIYGRVRSNRHEAANHGGRQTPFEVPVM